MIDYERLKAQKRLENRNKLYNLVLKAQRFEDLPKDVRIRVQNFCEREVFSIDKVFSELKSSLIFCAMFASDPLKQNFYETTCAEWLAPQVQDFRKLPVRGPDAFYFGDRGVVMGLSGGAGRAKSLDFTFRLGEFTVFLSHKFIDADGGAQDNQFNDQATFIEQACRVRAAGADCLLFAAICDGPYFQRRGRMESLRAACGAPGVVAAPHHEILAAIGDEAQKIIANRTNSAIHSDIQNGIADVLLSQSAG